jgi:competence protein ComEC
LLLISLIVLPFQINRTNTINTFSLFNNLLISSVMRPLFIFIYFFYFILRLPIFNFLIVFIIKIMGNMNFNLLNINIPNIPNIFIFLYLLMVMIFFYFAEINYKSAAKRTILIVCIPLLIYCLPINNFFTFEISFINVGQGDSTLIRYKEQAVLIDTGGLLYQDVATNSLIPFLRSKRIYALDDVIITHDDYDHSGALDSLREHYLVKNVINKDSMFPFKLNNSCLFENLNSFNYQTNDENYKSLVVKVSLSDLTLLIMGDAPIEIEQKIIDKYKPFSCDFLKVGHHGSNTSSSEDFIKFIKPKIAIISCGYKNKFKHPSASVIKILEKYDITIRRTDLEGTISYKFWV